MEECTIENIGGVCRLCAKNYEQMKPIYINQCTQYNLKFLIHKFLPFINVSIVIKRNKLFKVNVIIYILLFLA